MYCKQQRPYRTQSSRAIEAQGLLPIKDIKAALLGKRNSIQLKIHHQRVLVSLFVKSMAEFVKHLESKTDYATGFLLQQIVSILTLFEVRHKFVFVRVHLRFAVRQTTTPRTFGQRRGHSSLFGMNATSSLSFFHSRPL